MKKLLKLVLFVLLLAVLAGAVASYLSRKRFESMSDEEIRDMLASKLDGRVSDEQLVSIQDSVIAGVRGKRPADDDHYVEDVQHAVEDLTEVPEHIDQDPPHAIEDIEPVLDDESADEES